MATKRKSQKINIHSRNSKSLLAISVQIVFILIAIVYFFKPYTREILDYREEISMKKNTLSELTDYANYLADLATSTLYVEKEIIDYALPSDNDVITVLLTYEGIAQAVDGISINPISLEPGILNDGTSTKTSDLNDVASDVVSGLQNLDFSMTAKTNSRDSAEALLEELYKARRIFVIHDLGWSRSEEEGNAITLDLNLSAYHMQNPQVSASKALVKEGQGQQEFINEYKNTKIYEELVLDGVVVGKSNLFRPEGTLSVPVASRSAGLEEVPYSSAAAELDIDFFNPSPPTPTPNTTTTEERVFDEIFGDIIP